MDLTREGERKNILVPNFALVSNKSKLNVKVAGELFFPFPAGGEKR